MIGNKAAMKSLLASYVFFLIALVTHPLALV